MNNLTKEMIEHVFLELHKGLSLEEITDDIIRNSENFCENTFDFSDLKDYVQYIITLSKAQEPIDDLEKQAAFENTLKAYSIDASFLQDELITLSKFDKIIYQEGELRLAKLDLLFLSIREHCQMFLELEEIKNNPTQNELTLISSKSEKNEELINPKINVLKKAYKLTKSNEVLDSINIYEKFKEFPLETDMVLNLINNFPKESIKDPSIINIEAMKQARIYIPCNDIKFNEDKIIESMAVYIFSIYKKGSFINNLLGIKKDLSRLKVSEIANLLLSNVFENMDFNYRHTHVIKPTQHYSTFSTFQIPLLEFRNSKNYQEHPFLEKDVDVELLSFYKSK